MKAGCLTDPHVSVPSAAIHRSAATATAEPPDVHPGILLSPYGFVTAQYAEFSLPLPIANSSIFALPIIQPPCFSRSMKQLALYGGINHASIFEAHVVSTPFVRMISFTAIGAPWRESLLSASIFSVTYWSANDMYALYFLFSSFAFLRYAETTSAGFRVPLSTHAIYDSKVRFMTGEKK